MHSEWSRIAWYLTIINLCKVKIAGALDFKMAASCFLSIIYTGSDKQNKRIYNSEEHRKFYKVWHNKSKERREGFADRIE